MFLILDIRGVWGFSFIDSIGAFCWIGTHMPSLFNYMNYREFLLDYYNEKKGEHRFFSYRLFSEKAGFSSPNVLKLVIDKKRNLTKDSVFKFCKALKLNKGECEYFENLVFFNQRKTLEEKNTYLSHLMRYRNRVDPTLIEKSEYAYYSEWYHPVVRELLDGFLSTCEYYKIAQAVIPSISTQEAKKSIKLLQELGLIECDSKGVYHKKDASLSTGKTVKSVAIANYHKGMITLGQQSIERFKSHERNIESVTLGITEKTADLIKKKTHDFMMELLKIAENDERVEKVMQVNVQAFPVGDALKNERGNQK